MKKLLLLCMSVVVFQFSNAQSFYKHALVFSADYGFEAYSLSQQYSIQGLANSKTLNGVTTDGNFNFAGEFGLKSWLGVGVQVKIDQYHFSKDSSGYLPTASSGEVGALINIHIIHISKIDLMVGGTIGYSEFSYTVNSDNAKFYGNSLWTDAHITFRYYFGRIGLNASAYIPFTSYKDMTSNTTWETGSAVLNTWKSTGGGINVGIQFRLLSLPK